MATLDRAFAEMGEMDALALRDTLVHRLDPRAKIGVTLLFLVVVVSFDRYAVSALIPFLLYPLFLVIGGGIPMRTLLWRILIVSPFALMLGLFNPILDQRPLLQVGSWTLSGGWVSFFSILLRFLLTVGTALALVAVTGFHRIGVALGRLGVPRVFVVQLLMLYRYLFVLGGEAARMSRARALRSAEGRPGGLSLYGSLVGRLLLRALDRTQRIHSAMVCRGFDGEVRWLHPLRFRRTDLLFILFWSVILLLFRWVQLPVLLGAWAMGLGS